MMKNQCPVCKAHIYNKVQFSEETKKNEVAGEPAPKIEINPEDYEKYALPNWPDRSTEEGKNRTGPHRDNKSRYET